MPTPHLTPQISAGAMGDIARRTLALWRTTARGGVKLTKSEAKWKLEAEGAPLPPLTWTGYTYAAFRHRTGDTIILGSFPAGEYVGSYGGGAFIYDAPGSSWDVDEQIMRLIYNGGTATAPSIGGQISFAAAEAAFNSLAWAPSLIHGGGDISVLYFDAPYTDNVLTRGTPNPGKQPEFGIVSTLSKLVPQDQATQHHDPASPYTNGWQMQHELMMNWNGGVNVQYTAQVDVTIRVPRRGYLGDTAYASKAWYYFSPTFELVPDGGGAIGDMVTLTGNFIHTVTTNGVTPINDIMGFCYWVDGTAMTGAYFEITGVTELSATQL